VASQLWRDSEYRANRAAILAGHPACAVRGPGCTGVATTVDHIVARINGGDNSLANLRPCCPACNTRLGGRVGRARQVVARAAAAEFFAAAQNPHSPNRVAISPGTRANGRRAAGVEPRIPARGRTAPRLATPVIGDSSHGPAVARWVRRHFPFRPMAWNRVAWDRVLTLDHGRLVHRQALISVARQNSKTTWAQGLAGWWLTELADRAGPQTVLWLSHDLRLSERSFTFLHRILEPRVIYRTFSFGRQRMLLDNGSELAVASNTASAGHGFSVDLAIADESWRLKPECIDDGVIPSMRARPSPLLVMTSTAGDESSTLLRDWRERGLAAIEQGDPTSLCFLEWSMPAGADPYDARLWSWPNPCLGSTLSRDTLRAESHGPRSTFLRASLNQWVSSADSWLPAGQWDACRVTTWPDPAAGVVAAEVAQGGDRFYAVRAWTLNGIVYAAPHIVTESEDELWAALEAVYGQVDQLAITPTLQLHLPTAMNRRTVLVGLRELARHVPLVRSMIAAGQVAHTPSQLLDEHVGRAVATRQAGLSTAHSSGSIELARCLVWAVAMASRPATTKRPAIAVAGPT
jgi:hypothetical protein